jgi:hypothetical protein
MKSRMDGNYKGSSLSISWSRSKFAVLGLALPRRYVSRLAQLNLNSKLNLTHFPTTSNTNTQDASMDVHKSVPSKLQYSITVLWTSTVYLAARYPAVSRSLDCVCILLVRICFMDARFMRQQSSTGLSAIVP